MMSASQSKLHLGYNQQSVLADLTGEFTQLHHKFGSQNFTIPMLGGLLTLPKSHGETRLVVPACLAYRKVVNSLLNEVLVPSSGLLARDFASITVCNVLGNDSGRIDGGEPVAAGVHYDGCAVLLGVLSEDPKQPCTEIFPDASESFLPEFGLFLEDEEIVALESQVGAGLFRSIKGQPGEVHALGPLALHRRIWLGDKSPATVRTFFAAELKSCLSFSPGSTKRRGRFIKEMAVA